MLFWKLREKRDTTSQCQKDMAIDKLREGDFFILLPLFSLVNIICLSVFCSRAMLLRPLFCQNWQSTAGHFTLLLHLFYHMCLPPCGPTMDWTTTFKAQICVFSIYPSDACILHKKCTLYVLKIQMQGCCKRIQNFN